MRISIRSAFWRIARYGPFCQLAIEAGSAFVAKASNAFCVSCVSDGLPSAARARASAVGASSVLS